MAAGNGKSVQAMPIGNHPFIPPLPCCISYGPNFTMELSAIIPMDCVAINGQEAVIGISEGLKARIEPAQFGLCELSSGAEPPQSASLVAGAKEMLLSSSIIAVAAAI